MLQELSAQAPKYIEAEKLLVDAANSWREWRDGNSWANMSWQVSRGENGGMEGAYYRAEGYWLSVGKELGEDGDMITSFYFQNPQYFAGVLRLAPNSDCQVSELRHGPTAKPFQPVLLNPITVFASDLSQTLADPANFRVIGYKKVVEDDDVLHHFRLKTGILEISELMLVLSEKRCFLPIAEEHTYRNVHKTVHVEYSDWRQIGNQWVWGRQEGRITGDAPSHVSLLLDWDPAEKHSKRECWLSYYGLPEPYPVKPRWPWFLGITSAIVAIIGLILRSRS